MTEPRAAFHGHFPALRPAPQFASVPPPMSWFYRQVLRPLLFLQDSEPAHDNTLRALATVGRCPPLTRRLR